MLLLGSNTAACHPIVWGRIRDRQGEGATVIVADPRATPTARAADLHLAVRPGTDLALLNAMLHVIERDGLLANAAEVGRRLTDGVRGTGHPLVRGVRGTGLLLAVELAEACLTHRYGLDREQRRRMWLRSLEMRAAAPQEELARFGVHAVQTACAPAAAGSRCGHVSTFRCRIGTITVTCAIEHDIASQAAAGGRYRSSTDILGDPSNRYYGVGYKARTQRIAHVVPAPDGEVVQATITVEDPHTGRDDGFGGSYQPAVSMVDCFLSLAQLAQVVAYRIDGVDRTQSNTLWMRRMAFSSSTPVHPLDGLTDATVNVARSRRLKVGGDCWRALDLGGDFGAIQARGSIAHALPHSSNTEHAAA
jgi:hypothetical protein